MSIQEQFATLYDQYTTRRGDIAQLVKLSGLSRSALEKKRAGTARVLPWDVWALETALANKPNTP